MSTASKKTIKQTELPYLKRAAFKDEREYRILYTSKWQKLQATNVRIPLSCLKKVVFNPWMPKPLYEACAQTVGALAQGNDFEIVLSTVINNAVWQSYSHSAA